MKRLTGWMGAFIVSALLWVGLFSCGPAPGGSTWRDKPPARFQGDVVAGVVFTTEAGVQRMCPLTGGQVAVGCTVGSTIYAPNPCRWSDPYAVLVCHELGHVNGWAPAHER